MHWIGNLNTDEYGDVGIYECDDCGCAVSDSDLHKMRTGHDEGER